MSCVTLLTISCALAIIYFYIKKCYSYFAKHGVPSRRPDFFFGNVRKAAIGLKNMGEIITDIYYEFPKYKYVGFYKFLNRAVLIRDRELIGDLLVKDFSHFNNNDIESDEKVDYIIAKNLFLMRDQEWKQTKAMLSPMFTTGKIKGIFPLIEEGSVRLVKHLNQEISANRGRGIDGKVLCTQLTTENVASSVFGLEAKAFEGKSEFVDIANAFADQSYINSIKFFLVFMFPSLQKFLRLKFFKDSVVEYLTQIISKTLRYRKENNITRNDFLEHINQMKDKSTEFPFTDRDVVAQSGGFFIDGVETTASVMSYVVYEIAKHSDVQEKLRSEINNVIGDSSKLSYEMLNEMTYLDCVINESMRLHPPMMALFKLCNSSYTLPEIAEGLSTRLSVHPGDSIIIPVRALHMDPEYYHDPEEFIPERFTEENKNSIPKHAYIPYGTGPRVCIGIRFGMLQMKMGIVALLRNFQININDKMLPHEIHPSAFFIAPKRGFWFDFKSLNQ